MIKNTIDTIKSSLCDFTAEGGYEIICTFISTIMIIFLVTVYIPFSLLILSFLFILIEGFAMEGIDPISNFQNYKRSLNIICCILWVTSIYTWNYLDSFPPLDHQFNFELNIEFNLISYFLFIVTYSIIWISSKK